MNQTTSLSIEKTVSIDESLRLWARVEKLPITVEKPLPIRIVNKLAITADITLPV